jgi:ABC-type branched-subunit amino acid transport system substrate-binding protein
VDWATGYSTTNMQPVLPMRGMMALMMRTPRTTTYATWLSRVAARDARDGIPAPPAVSINEGIFYDITHYYIQAITNVTNSYALPMNGPDLLNALHETYFTGVTGPFIFDNNDDRAISDFDRIMNYTAQSWICKLLTRSFSSLLFFSVWVVNHFAYD